MIFPAAAALKTLLTCRPLRRCKRSMEVRCWVLGIGFRVLSLKSRVLGAGCWVQVPCFPGGCLKTDETTGNTGNGHKKTAEIAPNPVNKTITKSPVSPVVHSFETASLKNMDLEPNTRH